MTEVYIRGCFALLLYVFLGVKFVDVFDLYIQHSSVALTLFQNTSRFFFGSIGL